MLAGDLPTTVESCDILPLVVLGVVNTGFGCLLYFSAIPLIDAQTVAICDYIEPASAVLFSVIFLGEALGTDSFIGMLLIFCGVIVGEVVSRRTPVSGKDYCSGQNGHRGPRGLVLLSEVSMGCCPCSGRGAPEGAENDLLGNYPQTFISTITSSFSQKRIFIVFWAQLTPMFRLVVQTSASSLRGSSSFGTPSP